MAHINSIGSIVRVIQGNTRSLAIGDSDTA